MTAGYDGWAALVLLALVVVITVGGKWLLFRLPALAAARRDNLARDAEKRALAKYPPVLRASRRVGLGCNLFLFAGLAPFVVTLEARPLWLSLLAVVAILMLYDFVYYLTHRFLFHGQGYFRRVHAVHHQARQPSHIDALYVHPLETFIGLALFILTLGLVGWLAGGLHVLAAAVCIVLYTQINTLNHVRLDLPYFPFRTVHWMTAKHAMHHENMHRGNYAAITLLFDRLFGTLE